jgi:hypothetical protein
MRIVLKIIPIFCAGKVRIGYKIILFLFLRIFRAGRRRAGTVNMPVAA